MQSPNQPSTHHPFSAELHATFEAQVAGMQAGVPKLKEMLAHLEKRAAELETTISKYVEPNLLFQRDKQFAELQLSQLNQTLPSNRTNLSERQAKELNWWSHQLNRVSHSHALNCEGAEFHSRQLKTCKSQQAFINRRLEIIEWRAETFAALSDPAAMTSFPLPPCIGPCKDKSHDEPVCRCHIRAAFWLLKTVQPGGMKAERTMWHPKRFSCCAEEFRDGFKRMAKEITVVLANMDVSGLYDDN